MYMYTVPQNIMYILHVLVCIISRMSDQLFLLRVNLKMYQTLMVSLCTCTVCVHTCTVHVARNVKCNLVFLKKKLTNNS